MVYIVSDERIAVENFEQGKIYKVDFVDESILYGVCIGIGSDFVMLSGDISGYIFPLTMQTASQVSSIDLYDPTPPEPPVPWTNLLQYQTGVPPFEFTTTDTSLFSWYIIGEGVGDKTPNLFDKSKLENGWNINASGVLVSDTRRIATTTPIDITGLSSITLTYTSNNIKFIYATFSNGEMVSREVEKVSGTNIEVTGCDSLYICFYRGSETITTNDVSNIMLNTGSTALPYEPYGYKIPVICNEHTTNIYLDAPLSEGEILYSTDIDTAIVTDIGENELTVGTTQQPTSMQIVYKIADR